MVNRSGQLTSQLSQPASSSFSTMPSNEAMGNTVRQITAAMAFPGGIHVPSLTFFNDDTRQEIDWEVQEKHFEFLISSGLHGSEYAAIIVYRASSCRTDFG